MRSLARMAEARREDEWDRTSFILAEIHNAQCTREFDCVTPAQRNPIRRRGQREQTSGALHRSIAASLPEDPDQCQASQDSGLITE